jgi:hypothetical protein
MTATELKWTRLEETECVCHSIHGAKQTSLQVLRVSRRPFKLGLETTQMFEFAMF